MNITARNSPPLVSVCLPVFNGAKYLRSSIESILKQTFSDFELLIIDDGSTDDTCSIITRMAGLDTRIKFLSRANAGLVATLNELFDMARGEYVARMDADDICRPDRFRRQVDYLDSNSDLVAVGSRSLFVDPEGWPMTEFVNCLTHEQINASLMTPEIGILHPTVMLRRSALVRIGVAYREEFRYVEDLDFFLRLGEVGRLANLPEVLLEYRCHASSVSHLHTVAQSEAAVRAVTAAAIRRGVQSCAVASETSQAESVAQLHRKWAWWSLGSGHLRTARKHTRLALKCEPLDLRNLNLLVSVVRGSLRG